VERSGASVPAVLDPKLHAIARWRGPFLSVYLSSNAADDHATEHIQQRWQTLRRRLETEGASPETLSAVDNAVVDAPSAGEALGVVAAGPDDLWIEHDDSPLKSDTALWGPVPVLTPLVRWRQQRPAHVVVRVDRVGADIIGISRDEPPRSTEAGGAQWRSSVPRAGGWAHWRMQRRVEETWARNARAVADEVETMVHETHAELVVVAAEPKAYGVLRPLLRAEVARMVRTIDGGRSSEGDHDHVEDEVARLVRSVAAERTVAVLDEFHHQRDAHDRAADGPEPTVTALRGSQVDALLVREHSERADRRAWFDTDNPAICALEADALHDLGAVSVSEGPLVDVAVRAALLTGAAVQVVPTHGGPIDGVGALLRWTA